METEKNRFLYKLIPPRLTFTQDMTEAERKVMQEHATYWKCLIDDSIAITFGLSKRSLGSRYYCWCSKWIRCMCSWYKWSGCQGWSHVRRLSNARCGSAKMKTIPPLTWHTSSEIDSIEMWISSSSLWLCVWISSTNHRLC